MKLLKLIFKNFAKILAKKNLYIVKSLSYFPKNRKIETTRDYIRTATLELCYNQIIAHNVQGNVAELGVFKGDFAKRLNALFSNRKLYLFDTFEGFDKRDIDIEIKNDFSTGKQDFSNTSVDLVLAKMKFTENCIVKKGFFPTTATDVNDTFCFVSIDTDLYQPIYNGLQFFYPRLEKNGYIFIHDFNNTEYTGAKDAVLKFCKENNIPYFPIPDNAGTVVISK